MTYNLLHPKAYYSEFQRLLKFALKAHLNKQELTLKQKFSGTWKMFVVKMLLAILVGVSIGIIYDPENRTTSNMMERFSPVALLLVTVFILPLLEETAFRLSLKFNPIYFSLTVGVLGYYFVSKVIYQAKLSDYEDQFIIRAVLALILAALTYPIVAQGAIKRFLERLYTKHFQWILYIFCIGFAWMHITNYDPTWQHLLLMPIITFPKLVNALCYSYVRMNYGFLYCYLIHISTNAIAFTVNILTS